MKKRIIRQGPPMPMAGIAFPRDDNDQISTPSLLNEPSTGSAQDSLETGSGVPQADIPTSVFAQTDTDGSIEIAVELIDENPLAPRVLYTREMIEELALDIQAHGQYEAIKVIAHPHKPGRYMIADGWTRTLAVREFQVRDTLRAEVQPNMSPRDAALLGYRINVRRNPFCDYDKAVFMRRLEDDGLAPEQIRDALGLRNRTLVSRLRAFDRLAPEIIDLVHSNKNRISAKAAVALREIQDKQGVVRALRIARTYCEDDTLPLQWLIQLAEREPSRASNKPSANAKRIRSAVGSVCLDGPHITMSLNLPDELIHEASHKVEMLYQQLEEQAERIRAESSTDPDSKGTESD